MRTPPLDEDGQPPELYYAERVADRLVAELLGVCKGLICDGRVVKGEAMGLARWLDSHPQSVRGYPGDVLAQRLVRIMDDGVITAEECDELQELLRDVTGLEEGQPHNLTSHQFLDDPPPVVEFAGREFVFTGRMLYGTRKEVEAAAMARGGRVWRFPRHGTDYVVVGPIGSRAWIQSSYGTKLLRAAELRRNGARLRIVDEEHWLREMNSTARSHMKVIQ